MEEVSGPYLGYSWNPIGSHCLDFHLGHFRVYSHLWRMETRHHIPRDQCISKSCNMEPTMEETLVSLVWPIMIFMVHAIVYYICKLLNKDLNWKSTSFSLVRLIMIFVVDVISYHLCKLYNKDLNGKNASFSLVHPIMIFATCIITYFDLLTSTLRL
jgi:hypothetical protein